MCNSLRKRNNYSRFFVIESTSILIQNLTRQVQPFVSYTNQFKIQILRGNGGFFLYKEIVEEKIYCSCWKSNPGRLALILSLRYLAICVKN